MKLLHVAAEIVPWVKTGGLADVMAALPPAQARLGADVRLLLPGYPAVMEALQGAQPVVDLGTAFGALRTRLLRGRLGDLALPVYVVEAPYLYRRPGGPYQDAHGLEWPDNLQRFALLGWVAAHLAAGDADLDWQPDVLHAHDWHAALSCAYMADHAASAVASVFTVHNLAYQGLFPLHDWPLLGLASRLMSPAGLEYHGQLSFMKAGLKFADRIVTVSPRHAQEIATPEQGHGLDGVVRARGARVSGILNGIDEVAWNPAADPALPQGFSAADLTGKRVCRRALQAELGLRPDDEALLLVAVSRLATQKGLDLLLAAWPALQAQGVQLALQGTGDAALEAAFRALAQAHPDCVAVVIGYDEARAHRLIAAGDAIVVPSRYEPCGLTQLYGLRYGTLPVVRRVGGLADTVADATDVGEDAATGFVFDAATPTALQQAVERAVQLRRSQPERWRARQRRGMGLSLGWERPAEAYLELYRRTLAERQA